MRRVWVCNTNFADVKIDWPSVIATWLSDPEVLEGDEHVILQNLGTLLS